MKIHLFIDHTALLVNDHKEAVTVEPPCKGTLEIEGKAFEVIPGESATPVIRGKVGHARVVFTTERGVRHVGIRPMMAEGTPYSSIDFCGEYVRMRVHLDYMERQIDKLTAAYHALAAEQKRDALGMLMHNTKKTEE